MTRKQAVALAKFDKSYRARNINGKWCVWCDDSDHVVEFDRNTIEQWRAWGTVTLLD